MMQGNDLVILGDVHSVSCAVTVKIKSTATPVLSSRVWMVEDLCLAVCPQSRMKVHTGHSSDKKAAEAKL